MFATAADFHNTRLLGILTILATVFAIFRRTTVTSWVCTLLVSVFSHKTYLPGDDDYGPMLEPLGQVVKLTFINRRYCADRMTIVRCLSPTVNVIGLSS